MNRKLTVCIISGLSGRKPRVSKHLMKTEEDEVNRKQLQHDLKKTAKKGTSGNNGNTKSAKPKRRYHKHYEFEANSQGEIGVGETAKQIEKLKYTWGLWNRIP